jgi:hypothetical protein
MNLKERNECRKALVQYYVKLITAGASRNRARQLTAKKAHTLGPECAKMVSGVLEYLEGESDE